MVIHARLSFVDSFDQQVEIEEEENCGQCEYFNHRSGDCTFEDDCLKCKFDVIELELEYGA